MTGQPQHGGILAPGSVFEGKYRIVRELGRGGFGMVYLAHQEKMGRNVALKVLRAGAEALHHSAKDRFLREVKIISRLRHPNTVTIHDFGEAPGGVVYMVLEYIEGMTVKEVLKSQGAQPPRRALGLTAQIARSLAEAHRHGVIHRDLKPANIMVSDLETESDFVKVLDFGIARLLRTDQRDLTSVGMPEGERELIGTPRYMSPEQVRGESLSPASDVYSVGLILYEMLVGHPAVQGDTTLALISQQISQEPLRLDGLRALSPDLGALIRRATAKRVAQRFPDAETFGDAVDQTLLSIGGALPGSVSARQTGRFMAADFSGQHAATPSGMRSGSFPGVIGASQHGFQPGFQPDFDPMLEQTTNPAQNTLPQQHLNTGHHPAQPMPIPQTPVPAARELPVTDKIYEYGEGKAGIDPDLPPPPTDTNAFSVPDPSAKQKQARRAGKPPAEQTSGLEFGFEFVRMLLFGFVALVGLYFSFILVAPIFGHFVSGTLKLAGTLVLASAIPLLTALGENSKRERFEVIDKPYDRIVRVFVGTAIFSFGTGVLCALVMSGAVTHDLRKFPNWFMTDAQRSASIGKWNAGISSGIAQIVEDTTTAIGIYGGTPSVESAPRAPVITTPPKPTRPATRAQKAAQEQPADSDQPVEADSPADTPAADPGAKPPASRGSDRNNEDYVRW